ncbi:restriction endonuclease [Nocardia sp. NBC_01388]|uniref:restriction endonuclease n=1 Tax=Nocardia sp. NBC_01388 TaxID=2903596 RepID=UPI00324EE6F1
MRIARKAFLANEPETPQTSSTVLRTSSVWPRKYLDSQLRQDMGALIGIADDDTLLASFLQVAEAQFARKSLKDCAAQLKSIRVGIEDASNRLTSPRPLGYAPEHTHREAVDMLTRFLSQAHAAADAVHTVEAITTAEIAVLHSTFGDDPELLFRADESRVSPIDVIWRAWRSETPAIDGYFDSIPRYNAEVAELRTLEQRRAAYVASRQGWTERDLQRCDGAGLEALTADLLARDGMTVLRRGGGSRDQGADVIAVMPDGLRIVVQCKLRQRGPIGPQVLYEVNGTARQVHRADIPVVVTNSTFSPTATAFAADHAIRLIDDHAVRRWAMWGESFHDILELSVPDGN